MENKRLFLLDAYALIFRAYYALIKMPRIDSSGFNTSAIFGFVNTLEEVLRKERPTHMGVCFDPQGPTFRSEAYAEYKGEREATPEDIRLSVPIIKEIIRAYNITVLEVEGFEADDVIGTMAEKASKAGFTTYMMTPDKDFGQLVGPNVLQYKPSYRGQDFELRGEEEVCARYGIQTTAQVKDLLALMGDKIDNIPGCPGVGEKTAVKLIAEYGSVENLIANTASLKGALKKKIEDNSEQIIFSKYLATIRTDVPLDKEPEELTVCEPDREKLFAIFKSLEFRTLSERVRRRLDGDSSADSKAMAAGHKGKKQPGALTPSLFDNSMFDGETEGGEEVAAVKADFQDLMNISCEFVIVEDMTGLENLQQVCLGAGECGIFLTSEGENDMMARWHGTAVVLADGRGWYVPDSLAGGTEVILDLMARGDISKVTFQAKRDMVLASNRRTDDALSLDNFIDVSLLHYLLQPDMRHTLETMATSVLNHTMQPMPVGKGRKVKDSPLAGLTVEEIAPWACEQALVSLKLCKPLEEECRKVGLYDLYQEVEHPLVSVLADMERAGVRLDVKALEEAAAQMEDKLKEIERDIYGLAGEEFNIGSPAKVGEILFDKLQLDVKAKKTRTGQYSTSEDILEKIADRNPIVGKILEYRQLKKLLTTYLTALPANINPATGRVHTNYNQTVTATGRISSSAPNLQNIPIREGEGREIRRAFIPSDGNLFLSADYSQIELRLVADFADEEVMLDAFAKNHDIHSATAARIYHKDQSEVTPDERRHAKTANFGILYGITAFGLASRLGISRSEAKMLIDNYFATFPAIRKYMSDSVEKARETGYALTGMGRRRNLPDINSRNPVVRGYAERNAINAPIQGSAADIIKIAMIRIARDIKDKGLRSKMIMQVHDELNFDVVPEELPQLQEIVVERMQKAYSGRVTLTASCGAATNWLDAH